MGSKRHHLKIVTLGSLFHQRINNPSSHNKPHNNNPFLQQMQMGVECSTHHNNNNNTNLHQVARNITITNTSHNNNRQLTAFPSSPQQQTNMATTPTPAPTHLSTIPTTTLHTTPDNHPSLAQPPPQDKTQQQMPHTAPQQQLNTPPRHQITTPSPA